MTDDRDELIARVADALRPLPTVNADAKARVLIAVAAERERERNPAPVAVPSRSVRWMARVAGLAAAAVVALLLFRPSSAPRTTTVASAPRAAVEQTGSPAATLAANGRDAEANAVQPVQLVFRAPEASRVRVVGDFNAWDGDKAPMARDPQSGLWSITLALRPGRHVYAFLVDDTVWVRDPRAPAAKDADYGRPGSVLLVGRP